MMTDQEYKETQDRLMLFAGLLLRENQLGEFISRVDEGHSLGPVLQPTLYRKALYQGNFEFIEVVARALNEARLEIIKAAEKHPDLKNNPSLISLK